MINDAKQEAFPFFLTSKDTLNTEISLLQKLVKHTNQDKSSFILIFCACLLLIAVNFFCRKQIGSEA